jgi:hypothetical protein
MLNVWYTAYMEPTFSVSVALEGLTRFLPTLIPHPRRIVYQQF